MPPNGHCGVAGVASFRPMIPASSPSAILNPTLMSLVNTYAARPYFVLFARAMTSSIFEKSRIGMTGANGSSVSILASSDRPRSTVGSKKYPRSKRSDFLPPVSAVAPLPVASATSAAVASSELRRSIGPTSVPASSPLPSFSRRASATATSVNRSRMSAWTKNRLGLMHTWPLLRNFPATAALATTSGSASGKMIIGACPPSSRLRRFTWSAAARIKSLPTRVEPVKLIFRTAGFSMNSAAISSPGPTMKLATPGGSPASWRQSNTLAVESGVWSAGLHTIVQPAASAGAILRTISVIGKFHGPIAPTTPTGCLSVRCRLPGAEFGMTWP